MTNGSATGPAIDRYEDLVEAVAFWPIMRMHGPWLVLGFLPAMLWLVLVPIVLIGIPVCVVFIGPWAFLGLVIYEVLA